MTGVQTCALPIWFSAHGEINRNDFGISFNAPVPGGVMVSEKIQIEIEAEAVLQQD